MQVAGGLVDAQVGWEISDMHKPCTHTRIK